MELGLGGVENWAQLQHPPSFPPLEDPEASDTFQNPVRKPEIWFSSTMSPIKEWPRHVELFFSIVQPEPQPAFLSLPSIAQWERDRTKICGSIWQNSYRGSLKYLELQFKICELLFFPPVVDDKLLGGPSIFMFIFHLFFMPFKALPVYFQYLLSALRTNSSCVGFHETGLETASPRPVPSLP